jgi:hypothetical protein
MPRPRKQHHASFGSLTRLPSGRYRACNTGPDGLRRSTPVTFATKTAAEDWLARTRADPADLVDRSIGPRSRTGRLRP